MSCTREKELEEGNRREEGEGNHLVGGTMGNIRGWAMKDFLWLNGNFQQQKSYFVAQSSATKEFFVNE